jgi:hypothetical protein
VDSNSIYWVEDGFYCASSVMAAPVTGGPGRQLAQAQCASGLALDAANVYWTNDAGSYGSVMSVPLSGGATTTLATLQAGPRGIAVNATHVYWVNFEAHELMRIRIH